ncbi:MAG: thioredoxin family protein [bacterium]
MKIIVLVGRWSHECKEVEKFWKYTVRKIPVELEIIDVDSDKGMNLMDEFEVSSVPVTIINDEVAFIGMPDIKRVEELLDEEN